MCRGLDTQSGCFQGEGFADATASQTVFRGSGVDCRSRRSSAFTHHHGTSVQTNRRLTGSGPEAGRSGIIGKKVLTKDGTVVP